MEGIWNVLAIWSCLKPAQDLIDIETCISEVQWESSFLIKNWSKVVFHAWGHSNIASNGHSTLRELLMAIMDYHFMSSNSPWEHVASSSTHDTIHHNPGKLLYTTDSQRRSTNWGRKTWRQTLHGDQNLQILNYKLNESQIIHGHPNQCRG